MTDVDSTPFGPRNVRAGAAPWLEEEARVWAGWVLLFVVLFDPPQPTTVARSRTSPPATPAAM
jgi:hypothetical protein